MGSPICLTGPRAQCSVDVADPNPANGKMESPSQGAKKTSVHMPREAPGPTGRHATKFRDTDRDVALRRPGLSHQKGPLSADGAWQHGLCPPSGLLGAPLGGDSCSGSAGFVVKSWLTRPGVTKPA